MVPTYANLVPDDSLEIILSTLYGMDNKLQTVDDLFKEKQPIPFTPSATYQTLVQKISRLIEPNVETQRQTQAPQLLAWQVLLKSLPAKLLESECVMEIEHLPSPTQWTRMDKLYKRFTKLQRQNKGEINSIFDHPEFGEDDDDVSAKQMIKELISALNSKSTSSTSKTTKSSKTSSGALTLSEIAGSNNNALGGGQLLPIVQTADGQIYAINAVKNDWNGQPATKDDPPKPKKQYNNTKTFQGGGQNRDNRSRQFNKQQYNQGQRSRSADPRFNNYDSREYEAPMLWAHEKEWCKNHRKFGSRTQSCRQPCSFRPGIDPQSDPVCPEGYDMNTRRWKNQPPEYLRKPEHLLRGGGNAQRSQSVNNVQREDPPPVPARTDNTNNAPMSINEIRVLDYPSQRMAVKRLPMDIQQTIFHTRENGWRIHKTPDDEVGLPVFDRNGGFITANL